MHGEREIVRAIATWLNEVADDADEQRAVFGKEQTKAIRICADMLVRHDAWRRHLPARAPDRTADIFEVRCPTCGQLGKCVTVVEWPRGKELYGFHQERRDRFKELRAE